MRPPAAWRALPAEVRRAVVRDARRGVPPDDVTVARAAAEWAGWAHRFAGRLFGVVAVVLVLALALAAAAGPRLLLGVAGLPFTLVAAALSRRDAGRVRAALARRRPG